VTRGTTVEAREHIRASPESLYELGGRCHPDRPVQRSGPTFTFLVYRCFMGVKDREADLESNMRKSLAGLKGPPRAPRRVGDGLRPPYARRPRKARNSVCRSAPGGGSSLGPNTSGWRIMASIGLSAS
jgi:hypothetical protein